MGKADGQLPHELVVEQGVDGSSQEAVAGIRSKGSVLVAHGMALP